MEEIIYIDKDDDDGTDALFWADYLVDDDSDVAPLVLIDRDADTEEDAN